MNHRRMNRTIHRVQMVGIIGGSGRFSRPKMRESSNFGGIVFNFLGRLGVELLFRNCRSCMLLKTRLRLRVLHTWCKKCGTHTLSCIPRSSSFQEYFETLRRCRFEVKLLRKLQTVTLSGKALQRLGRSGDL